MTFTSAMVQWYMTSIAMIFLMAHAYRVGYADGKRNRQPPDLTQ